MQYLRGYIYFEGKSFEEVCSLLKNFRLNQSKIYFFENIFLGNEKVDYPGVIIDGFVNKEYSSFDVVKTFRKIMGLPVEVVNCDISLESEDVVSRVVEGVISGEYVSVGGFLGYTEEMLNKLAALVIKEFKPVDVVVRSSKKETWCLDLIMEKDKLDRDLLEAFLFEYKPTNIVIAKVK